MTRPEIRSAQETADPSLVLIDVTLRDGGYVNHHSWSRSQARAIVAGCAKAGVPYSEVGYFRPGRHAERGDFLPAGCCPPGYLSELREVCAGVTLTVMAHARDVRLTDYQMLADCGVGLVRL